MDELLRQLTLNLRGMWTYRWLGLATAWIVGAGGLVFLLTLPVRYEATARILVNTDTILKPLMTGLTVLPNEEQRITMLSRVLISRPNVDKLVRTVGLDAKAASPEERERIIDATMTTLELRGGTRDSIYTLSFQDDDPRRAQRALEVLAQMFIESSKGGKEQDTDAAKAFIEEQIGVYEKKLQEAEGRLKEFRLRNIFVAPGDGRDGRDFFVRMTEASNQLNQARLELSEAQRAREALLRRLSSEDTSSQPGAPAPSETNALIADIDTRLEAMKRNLDTLMQRYTEDHPDVVGARRVIRELEAQKRPLVANRRPGDLAAGATTIQGPRAAESLKVSLAQTEASIASLSARVAEFSSRYERMKSSAVMVPQLEAEYAQLNRDYDVHKKNYESLVARRESANISGQMQTVAGVGDFRLVDPPRVSPRPVSPKLGLFPLTLLASLLAGLAAAFLAREARPTIFDGRSAREVTGLPLLGVVSIIASAAELRQRRRSLAGFAGGIGALVLTYGAGLAMMELIVRRAA